MAEHDNRAMAPAPAGAALLLAASYALAGGAALALVHVIGNQMGAAVLAIVVAVAVGLSCTAALLWNLNLLDLALARLGRGLIVAPIAARRRWPLRGIFVSLDAAARRIEDGVRREREVSEYREQVLAKVGAAAAQEERNRLARELHDSIKQQLFSISMSAAATEARWASDPAGARAAVADVQRSAREALVEMEALLQELRPGVLESVGLREAIQTQCEAVGYRTGATVQLEDFDIPSEDRLPPAAPEALFRIVQEALSNVARHSRARIVTVRVVQHGDSITLSIRDDGQGFEPARTRGGSGLAGMRERMQSLGGKLELETVLGRGTAVRAHLPLQQPVPAVPRTDGAGRAREERRSAIEFATLVEQVTVLLIFLGAPISTILLGLGVALAAYGRSRLVAARLSMQRGAASDDDRETYQEWGLLSGALSVGGLCAVYLYVAQPGWHVQLKEGMIVVAAIALEALAVIAAFHWQRGVGRYLNSLGTQEGRRAADERIRAVRASAGAWAVVVVIALLVGLDLRFPPHTLNQWSDDSTLAILGVWPLIDALDYLRTVRRQRRLAPTAI